MWKLLNKDPPYFISFLEEGKDFYIGVTNFQQYWTYVTTRSTFLNELKVSNEGLEFDDGNELIKRGLDMIKNPESLKSVSVTQDDKENFLNVSMRKVFEITLKTELRLLKAPPQIHFEVVVQPLIKTVCDLRSSQHELRELLLKKDREIEEYKIEGKAPRRLITTVYDDAAHMMKHTTFEEYFSASEVPGVLTAIANTSKPKSKTSVPPKTKNSNVQKTESTTSDPSKSHQSHNGNRPLPGTINIVPKIEKCSQNTLIDESDSLTGIKVSTFEAAPIDDVKDIKHSLNPVPKKRQKKQLNY